MNDKEIKLEIFSLSLSNLSDINEKEWDHKKYLEKVAQTFNKGCELIGIDNK